MASASAAARKFVDQPLPEQREAGVLGGLVGVDQVVRQAQRRLGRQRPHQPPGGDVVFHQQALAERHALAVDGRLHGHQRFGECGAALRKAGLGIGQVDLVLASGMITSNVGLCEVPHLPAPAGLRDLAAGELLHVITHNTILADSLDSDFAGEVDSEMLLAGARERGLVRTLKVAQA